MNFGNSDIGGAIMLFPILIGGLFLLLLFIYTINIFKNNTIEIGKTKESLLFVILILTAVAFAFYIFPKLILPHLIP